MSKAIWRAVRKVARVSYLPFSRLSPFSVTLRNIRESMKRRSAFLLLLRNKITLPSPPPLHMLFFPLSIIWTGEIYFQPADRRSSDRLGTPTSRPSSKSSCAIKIDRNRKNIKFWILPLLVARTEEQKHKEGRNKALQIQKWNVN